MQPCGRTKQAIGCNALRSTAIWHSVLKELLTDGSKLRQVPAPTCSHGLFLCSIGCYAAEQRGRAYVALNGVLRDQITDSL